MNLQCTLHSPIGGIKSWIVFKAWLKIVETTSLCHLTNSYQFTGSFTLFSSLRQELARLQEPSRSSNIEDLDNLLDDLNFVQKNYNPDRKSELATILDS